MKRILLSLAPVAIAVAFAGSALAGPQYVDKTKFAVSGYDVVAYWGLKQNAVGKTQPKAVAGKKSITAEHNGATWAFSSEENKQKFLADPAKYVPQYDGHCAYGASIGNDGKGGKVPGNPHLWRIVDGKLYLNITKAVVGFWEKNVPGHISKADKNWTSIGSKPASKRNVPSFSTASAPL
ncbi:MAG: YHS domain-containing (seleno)protein [Pseudomonadota bacterium]